MLAIFALALLAVTAQHRTMAVDDAYRLHFLVVRPARLHSRVFVDVGPGELPSQAVLRRWQVGDWGRNGVYNQSLVAAAMGRVAGDLDFVVSVGDNFYESGLTSVLDPQFDTSFREIYTAPNLQVGFLASPTQSFMWECRHYIPSGDPISCFCSGTLACRPWQSRRRRALEHCANHAPADKLSRKGTQCHM